MCKHKGIGSVLFAWPAGKNKGKTSLKNRKLMQLVHIRIDKLQYITYVVGLGFRQALSLDNPDSTEMVVLIINCYD